MSQLGAFPGHPHPLMFSFGERGTWGPVLPGTNVPRSPGSPDHPSTPSPRLTHVREEQGDFYPKDMGLIALCLMLCTLVAKQHAPGAPPDQEQGPYHLDNILEM